MMWKPIFRRSGNVAAAFMLPISTKVITPTVIYGKDIYLGLGYIKELEIKVVQRILENRNFFGPY